MIIDPNLGVNVVPDCRDCPFDPNIGLEPIFWQNLTGSEDLFLHWLEFLSLMSNNQIMQDLQNGGLQENIFNYSIAALWARNLRASFGPNGIGLNSVVTYLPPYAGHINKLTGHFADVGVFQVTQHDFVHGCLSAQETGPLVYQFLRDAATRRNADGSSEVLLKPLAFVETKYLRKSRFSGSCAVSVRHLFDDMEKLREILALTSTRRPVLPLALWLIDLGDAPARGIPVDGIGSQDSLRQFLNGNWMSDERVKRVRNVPYEYLSDAMQMAHQSPHFQINVGGRVQKVWIHRLAFLRYPDQANSRYRIISFVPCKISCT